MRSLEKARNAINAGQPRQALEILGALDLPQAPEGPCAIDYLYAQAAMLVPEFDLALRALRRVVERVCVQGLDVLPPAPLSIPLFLDSAGKTARVFSILHRFRQAKLPVFPFFGTLLGIVRDNQVIEGDKDVDLAVWLEHFDEVKKLLQADGFRAARSIPPFDNFCGFVCPQTNLVIDLMGLRREANKQRVLSGFWLYDKPADWQRESRYDWFELIEQDTPKGIVYLPDKPEPILKALYGNWRTPDSQWDSLIQAENLLRITTQYRCYAYVRILEVLRRQKWARALYLATAACRRMPDDTLLSALKDKLQTVKAR